MIRKKSVILLFSFVIMTILLLSHLLDNNRLKSETESIYLEETDGFYVLSNFRKVYYLSSKSNKILSETDVSGAMYMARAKNGKVYVPVRGNLSKGGTYIDVFKNGKKINTINLKYSLPEFAKYNPYNGKLYVNHIAKITHQEENCITVINTSSDSEEDNIMYNNCVEDISFPNDKTMLISSWGIKGGDWKIDVFNLKDKSITKTIHMDIKITSMVALPDSSLLFGVSEMLQEPYLYVIDWEKGTILEKILLKYNYPSRIRLKKINDKYRIYVAHRNTDDNSGENISIIEPYERKVIDEIVNIKCPTDIAFNKDNVLVANWKDNLIYIINDNDVIKTININRPLALISTDN